MRKTIFLTVISFFLAFTVYAQIPNGFNNNSMSVDLNSFIVPGVEQLTTIIPDYNSLQEDLEKAEEQARNNGRSNMINNLKNRIRQFENIPKYTFSSDAVEKTLEQYKNERLNEIKKIKNIADKNDEIGVLDREVKIYKKNLVLRLEQLTKVKNEALINRFENTKAEFYDFNTFLKKESAKKNNPDQSTRSTKIDAPTVNESKAVEVIVNDTVNYDEAQTSINEKHESIVNKLEDRDDEIAKQLAEQIKIDKIEINKYLEKLDEEKLKIKKINEEMLSLKNCLSYPDKYKCEYDTEDEMKKKLESYDKDLEKLLLIYEEDQKELQRIIKLSEEHLLQYNLTIKK